MSCTFSFIPCRTLRHTRECDGYDYDNATEKEHNWPEAISNEGLWGRTHQSRIEESIKRRKWKWIGHTLRKPENNITHSALEGNAQGFRRRGRPRQSWRRSVQDELAKKNFTWLEAKRTAKNIVRKRSMVDALCSPRGAKMAQ